MKKIILKELRLTNFKGIKELTVNFEEGLTNIFGDNGTGKTTVFDAYSWLLWDKDSLNRSDFNIKSIDETGNAISNQEHIVEGIFLIEDKEVTFKKIYEEKWTKKRGNIHEEFSGHETEYYVNEVPVRKKDYVDRIGSIITEDQFKLLSNPMHFNVNLKNDKRREILMGLVKTITNEDIIKLNPELEELPLDNYTIEEIQAMNKKSFSKINKDIEELPVRIDELHANKKEFDFETLRINRKVTAPALAKIDEELNSMNGGAEEVKTISKEILELTKQAEAIKNDISMKNNKLVSEYDRELRKQADDLASIDIDILKGKELLENAKANSDKTNEYIENLREEYRIENAKELDLDTLTEEDKHCKYCKQSLPEDDLIGQLNLIKSNALAKIKAEGDVASSALKTLEERIPGLESKIAELEEKKAALKNLVIEKPEELQLPKEYFDLEEQIKAKEQELENVSVDDNREEKLAKRKELQEELDRIDAQLLYEAVNKNADEKIEQYQQEQKELARRAEDIEMDFQLCDEYTRAKVELISKDLNEQFELVGFKLFEEQVNGGITETCEATIDGVPFSDANNASKINAGIDIINTLSEAYGISTPIFVDNAESVNELIETDSQVVRLVVSKDKELKVA